MPFVMSAETTNSWIFLAVGMGSAESALSLREIIRVADGINHAIPTDNELQDAFGWLLKQGLISKEGKKYRLTKKGLILYREASAKSNRIFGMWDYLKEHFVTLNYD
ncbi:MAG: hypothetical protein M3033_17035 [Acidobacteriota bacterium]|nr:hypothetical protein [Acidobacteriota bacterium]